MFLEQSRSHCEEIETEHFILIRITKKFGSPNIPSNIDFNLGRAKHLS